VSIIIAALVAAAATGITAAVSSSSESGLADQARTLGAKAQADQNRLNREAMMRNKRQLKLERDTMREQEKQLIIQQREDEEALEEKKADLRKAETQDFLGGMLGNDMNNTTASIKKAQSLRM
jgi:Na+-translocating ferredoxin:NAD+ oxidoreductase RnfG subunit